MCNNIGIEKHTNTLLNCTTPSRCTYARVPFASLKLIYHSNGVICKIGKIAEIYFLTVDNGRLRDTNIHTIEIVFDV